MVTRTRPTLYQDKTNKHSIKQHELDSVGYKSGEHEGRKGQVGDISSENERMRENWSVHGVSMINVTCMKLSENKIKLEPDL